MVKTLVILLTLLFAPVALYGYDDRPETTREILIDIRDELYRQRTGDPPQKQHDFYDFDDLFRPSDD